MRHRQERLLSVVESDVQFTVGTEAQLTQVLNESTGEIEIPPTSIAAEFDFTKPDELTWWDWVVYLLHTAADIEHALMVQYLYAAYSLGEGSFQGPNVPPSAQTLVNRWRRTIVGIAKEEMGHLITVQNLLR